MRCSGPAYRSDKGVKAVYEAKERKNGSPGENFSGAPGRRRGPAESTPAGAGRRPIQRSSRPAIHFPSVLPRTRRTASAAARQSMGTIHTQCAAKPIPNKSAFQGGDGFQTFQVRVGKIQPGTPVFLPRRRGRPLFMDLGHHRTIPHARLGGQFAPIRTR